MKTNPMPVKLSDEIEAKLADPHWSMSGGFHMPADDVRALIAEALDAERRDCAMDFHDHDMAVSEGFMRERIGRERIASGEE